MTTNMVACFTLMYNANRNQTQVHTISSSLIPSNMYDASIYEAYIYAYQCFCSSILQNGGTPLMVASEQGHLPVVKTLLEHSAIIDLKDEVWR